MGVSDQDKLSADPKMAWVEDFSDGTVRGIGAEIAVVLPAPFGPSNPYVSPTRGFT